MFLTNAVASTEQPPSCQGRWSSSVAPEPSTGLQPTQPSQPSRLPFCTAHASLPCHGYTWPRPPTATRSVNNFLNWGLPPNPLCIMGITGFQAPLLSHQWLTKHKTLDRGVCQGLLTDSHIIPVSQALKKKQFLLPF